MKQVHAIQCRPPPPRSILMHQKCLLNLSTIKKVFTFLGYLNYCRNSCVCSLFNSLLTLSLLNQYVFLYRMSNNTNCNLLKSIKRTITTGQKLMCVWNRRFQKSQRNKESTRIIKNLVVLVVFGYLSYWVSQAESSR